MFSDTLLHASLAPAPMHALRVAVAAAILALSAAAPQGECDVCHLHYLHKVRRAE